MAAQLSSAQETSAFGSFASGGGNEAAAGEWADFGSGGDDFGDAYVPFLPPPPSRPKTDAEKFAALMEAEEWEKAAHFAATSPSQELRTRETAAKATDGGKPPVLRTDSP
ncbi:hypothetical protein EMIHUDRAFT_230287 [Emiliania huxleyi CCMP1516]|uniref:Clathrin light chain n=2 Tax=Emiliania huxleyi TaxID=2903 RepID=A0A0D3KAV8_EMIH1|nr:hypothetical protein EMIHUDRAFT_230287 [Emiliania huxleyi CCMP1516]EOD32893.1 hypothetical protein EMIHUDRAFT_230287 [Emiliania huxleyi CCMP1516]|eukprot:XP_005785322.1 hypothetical protein EMIHUDRAFT_230287 [Emiliania huxleyi CCMP1516]